MSKSICHELASQWFAEYSRLGYWVARRWVQRLLFANALDCNRSELEELAQDAICRGFDRFAKRCQREVCGRSDRKRWVCQCVIRGARDAVRGKSSFGSITDGAAVRDDVMNRAVRVYPGFVHGIDHERQGALEQVHYSPVVHAVQRWELDALVERELPAHLRPTATYAACGLTHEQSAILQSVSARTVRNRLREIRELLDPSANIYAIVCDALRACLDRPQPRRLPQFASTCD